MLTLFILTLLISPIQPAAKKQYNPYKIVICLKKQLLYLFKEDELVFETKISSGMGKTAWATPVGYFRVGNKADAAYAEEWEVWVYQWMQFAGRNGMHSLQGMQYYRLLGRRASHGCVRLNHEAAKYFYSFIPILTEVWVLEEFDSGISTKLLTPKTRSVTQQKAEKADFRKVFVNTPVSPYYSSLSNFFTDFGFN